VTGSRPGLRRKYGAKGYTEWKLWNKNYFEPLQAWPKSSGVPWGLAETGYSDPAAKDTAWMSRTYGQLKDHGGIAFSYFNTTLHSQANWARSAWPPGRTPSRRSQVRTVVALSSA
jgi:hypothetical protein